MRLLFCLNVCFFHLSDGHCSKSFLQPVISPCILSQHKTLKTLKTCCLFIWMQLSFHNFENRTFGEFSSIHDRIMQDHSQSVFFPFILLITELAHAYKALEKQVLSGRL